MYEGYGSHYCYDTAYENIYGRISTQVHMHERRLMAIVRQFINGCFGRWVLVFSSGFFACYFVMP